MADEQTIYISPDDDLTTVRERLERLPSRRVTLVIPAQTQLRSHVAWKLLYARARELGKEVLVVSSDPQVRSVAHAVKFKVAHSLESPQSGKTRPSSRPVRPGVGVRSRPTPSSAPRGASGRSQAGARGTGGLGSRQAPLPEPDWYASTPEAAPSQPEPEMEGPVSHPDEIVTGGLGRDNSTFEAPEQTGAGLEPYRDSFRLDASPPIQPLSPQQIEEPDLLFEDYNLAQDIRQAAGETGKIAVPPGELLRSFHATPQPGATDDPFAYMEDLQPPPQVAEQRGAVSIEGYGDDDEYVTGGRHVVEDISEMPTEIIDGEIEDQGDIAEFVLPPTNPPAAPGRVGQGAQKGVPPSLGARPRSGYLPPVAPPAIDDDALPPVEERPTQIVPPPITLPTAPPRETRQQAPAASQATQRPPAQRGRVPVLSKPPARPPRQQRVTPRRPPAASRAPSTGRGTAARPTAPRRVPVGLIAIIVIALLVIGCLAYFGPAADVTITLYAHSFSRPLTLTARPDKQPGTILAQRMTKVFDTSGTGKATGSKMVGSAIAKGDVTFTNSGTKPVEIPTGTIIATAGPNGVQYQTMADAVISPGTSNNPPVPVQAVKPGDTGNVGAGAAWVIPDDSLSAIAKYQSSSMTPAELKLTVTNQQAIAGGGMQPATTVTSTDLVNLKNSLHQQIVQNNVAAWLKQLSASGVMGSPVVASDTLVNAPPVDQVENGGSFTAGYTMSVAVLLLPTGDLQRAALAQLQSALRADKNSSGYILATDVQPAVKIDQLKSSSPDANTLKLNFTATAMAVPDVSKEQVQRMIAGTSLRVARTNISSQIKGVQRVDITPLPGFIWFVPAWSEHINVIIKSGSVQPTK